MTAHTIAHSTRKLQAATKSTSNDMIRAVGPYDILFGRTKNAYHNIGNRRFRVTIMLYLEAYLATKLKSEKTSLIRTIVNMLRNDVGARFLQPAKGGGYVELEEVKARQKVGHALRDMAVSRHQSTMTEWTENLKKQDKILRPQHDKSEESKSEPNLLEAISLELDSDSSPLDGLFQDDNSRKFKGWFVGQEIDDSSVDSSCESLRSGESTEIDAHSFLRGDGWRTPHTLQ